MILGDEGSDIICTFLRSVGDKSGKSAAGEKTPGTKYKVLAGFF
jgi:hypothetical protein